MRALRNGKRRSRAGAHDPERLNRASVFITIEGIEGSGKTTQVRLLAERLERAGRAVQTTREPGGTPLGERLRELLLHDRTPMSALAELFLLLADRAEHVAGTIRPALARGEVVLCDRFSDSTLAYQAYGRGLRVELVRVADAGARDGLLPDLTFVLDCPVDVGLARTRKRRGGSEADRFEGEDVAFHERVRSGFLELAGADRSRIQVIDGMLPVDDVRDRIFAEARARLGVPS